MGKFSKYDLAAVALVGAIPVLAGVAGAVSKGWSVPGDAAFWGSILGAVVGGSIALVGQWITIRDVRQHRLDEQAARDRAHGTAFLFKLVEIFNHLHNIDRNFREALDNERARRPGAQPWQVYRPSSFQQEPVRFSTEEMVVLVSRAPANLTGRCVGLDNTHNALLDGIAKVDDLRTAFVAMLEPDNVNGHVLSGHVQFDPRQLAQMNLINSLLEGFRASCAEDLAQARQALVEVNALFRRELGLTISVSPQ